MKIVWVVTVVVLMVLMAFGAWATDPDKKPATPKKQAQQEKMKACSAEAKAKGLKGDERKKFMSECLKKSSEDSGASTPATESKTTQQEKMKACNAEAKTKGLKGDERKKFMSECLKAAP